MRRTWLVATATLAHSCGMGKKSRRKQSTRHAIANSAASLENLARYATGDERYPALSGLRGLAALAVFCLHAYALTRLPKVWPGHDTLSFLLAWPMKMGWAGVDVFFTLSAFLLALPFVRAQMSGAPEPGLRGYAARRALRILPAYGLQLLVLLALLAMGAATGIISHEVTAIRLLAQPLFLYDISWPGVFSMQWPLLATWWTLPVEVGFYVLLPGFARLLRPGRWHWLLLGIAFAWCWRAWLLWTQPSSYANDELVDHLPGRIDQFLIGMLAAYAVCRAPRLLSWVKGHRANAVFVIAALVFLALPALGYLDGKPVDAGPSRHPLLIGWHSYASVVVAAMLIAACRNTPLLVATVGALPLRLLGRISYGLYLWHLPVLLWLKEHGGVDAAGGPLPFALYGLLFSLLAAIASWWLVERPALRFAARWPHDERARMPTPVSVDAP